MSLLATASPWNSSEETISKKRTPMLNSNIRKTVKNRPSDTSSSYNDETSLIIGSGNSNSAMSIDELQQYNSDKQSKVHQMLDHITKVDTNTDNKLGDFTPVMFSQPTVPKPNANTNSNPANLLPTANPLSNQMAPSQNPGNGLYLSNGTHLGKYTNYRNAHDPSLLRSASLPETSQYYSRNGANKILSGEDNRFMDKINYMIHLLEEQQMEKTNNVMEEFVLYSLLGVFVIYVVDSFSRAGKYMR
jgi:hypothetical protein